MLLLQVLMVTFLMTCVSCSIDGLSYLDPLNIKHRKSLPPGEDPCNPLYWYPRQIPDSCHAKFEIKLAPKPVTQPTPVAIPHIPVDFPMPFPPLPAYSLPQPYPYPGYPMPAPPIPMPMYPQPMPPPLPFGVPIEPSNPMLPVAGVPAMPYPMSYPFPAPLSPPQHLTGLVPGIPGIVSRDGGINVLPFSDAYANMLENHKQKMLRKKLRKIFDDYNDDCPRKYPGCRRLRRRRHRKY